MSKDLAVFVLQGSTRDGLGLQHAATSESATSKSAPPAPADEHRGGDRCASAAVNLQLWANGGIGREMVEGEAAVVAAAEGADGAADGAAAADVPSGQTGGSRHIIKVLIHFSASAFRFRLTHLRLNSAS
jgi:hypothetical protein